MFDKNKVKIKISFNKKTQDINVDVSPEVTRPTELIQILMYAINAVNTKLQEELDKEGTEETPEYIS